MISGAGIGGPTLAYWLKAGGFTPTLVERASALRAGGYVIDFWGLGYDIAQRMGLGQQINRVGYHVREMRIVDDHGRRVAGFGTKVFDELTGGRYVTLARSDLSRLLFEKAAADTIFDDEITSIQEQSDGVEVEFRRSDKCRFDLVVGADGLHSNVRRIVFGPEQQVEKCLGYAVAAFEAKGYRPRDEDIYLMYGWPGQMVGRFTLREDRTLFLFVFATSDYLPTALDQQKAILLERYRDGLWECPLILEQMSRTSELYLDTVSQIMMPRWSRGRVVLLGDAACCVSLTAGQGSALAMISAYVLAGELLGSGGNYPEAFRNYEAVLRDYIYGKQQGAERFAGAIAPRTRGGLWFRNQVVKALAIPGLARLSVGRDIIDTLRLPTYRWPCA